jgi:cell division protein FtsI/penicillin-binding protein 2
MNPAQQNRRHFLFMGLLLGGFGWCAWELFRIQVLKRKQILAEGRNFIDFTQEIPALRGEIRARDGTPLAISEIIEYVYVNLRLCEQHVPQVVQACAPIFGVKPAELQAIIEAGVRREINQGPGNPQPLLLRNVSVRDWRRIKSALTLENFGLDPVNPRKGEQELLRQMRRHLFFAREVHVRRYPGLTIAPHVVGFALPDTNGSHLRPVSGAERGCDSFLSGTDGEFVSQQDAGGNELPGRRVHIRPVINGNNVVLTLDSQFQASVQRAVEAARVNCQAKSASAIVLEARTGGILAVACAPGYDASAAHDSIAACWRNPAFVDNVEPGSTFKMVVLAAILEQGKFNLDSGVYCENGRYVVDHVVVNDHERLGMLNVRECFARSSNIAFSKLGMALGPALLYRAMMNFGFNQPTGIPFVAESRGRIEKPTPANWKTMQLTRAAFGQGFQVSQLQMAVAASVIANDGKLMRPSLVSRIESPDRRILQTFPPVCLRQVIRPQIARLVKEAMIAVASPGGTGAKAAMTQYSVAAKTGTAQKSDNHGYINGAYYSSMIGFFPADATPRLVVSVALDQPTSGYYAADVAAPAFRAICEAAASRFEIPPDKINPSPPAHGVLAALKTAPPPPVMLAREGAR